MELKLEFALFAFLAIGLFAFIAALVQMPSRRKVKNLSYLTRQAMGGNSSISAIADDLADKIAGRISLSEAKKEELESQLRSLDLHMTPEKYIASAISKGLILVPVAIPFLFLHWILSAIIVGVAVFISFQNYNKLNKIFAQRKKEIDAELPRFVAVVQQTFKYNTDVMEVLNNYVQTDETALTQELKIVIADMNTGDYEVALTRMAKRINSIYLSETVRGLVSAARGEETTHYFANLNEKLTQEEEAAIQAMAKKLPSKIKVLVVMNLSSIALIYLVIFTSVILTGVVNIFGS